MLKIIWKDFRKKVLPKILLVTGALTIGFIFNIIIGHREDHIDNVMFIFVVGPTVGAVVMIISYSVYTTARDYLAKVKRRAELLMRENQSENSDDSRRRAEPVNSRENFEF